MSHTVRRSVGINRHSSPTDGQDSQRQQQQRQQQQQQQQQQRTLLDQMDVQGTRVMLLFSLSGMLTFLVKCASHPDIFQVVVLESTEMLLLLCQLLLLSTSRSFYKRYRTQFMFLLQSIKFVITLKYLPLGFKAGKESPLFYSGRELTYARHILFLGLASGHIAFDTLTGRFPMLFMLPLTLVRLFISTWFLLRHVCAMLNDPVLQPALTAWKDMLDGICDHVILFVTFPDCMLNNNPVSNPCPGTSLALWCHCFVGGLLPVYFVAVMSSCKCLQEVSLASLWNDSSTTSGPGQQNSQITDGSSDHSDCDRDLGQHHDQQIRRSRSSGSGSGSSSSRSSAAGTSSTSLFDDASRSSSSGLPGARHVEQGSAAQRTDNHISDRNRHLDQSQPIPVSTARLAQQPPGLWQQQVMEFADFVCARGADEPASVRVIQQPQQHQQHTELVVPLSATCRSYGWYAIAFHVGVLVICSMLLWVLIDTVIIWKPAEAYLRRSGLCV